MPGFEFHGCHAEAAAINMKLGEVPGRRLSLVTQDPGERAPSRRPPERGRKGRGFRVTSTERRRPGTPGPVAGAWSLASWRPPMQLWGRW